MALDNCIKEYLSSGRITDKYAKKADDVYQQKYNYYKATLGDDVLAQEQATKAALDQLEREYIQSKYKMIKQQEVQRRIVDDLNSYNQGKDFDKAAQALIESDDYSRYSSLSYRQREVHGALLSKMDEVLSKFGRRGVLGSQQNKPLLREMTQAIFDPDSVANPLAKELAEAWKEAAELARLRFNKAGGSIPKRADWGMSQIHDSYAIDNAGFDEWYGFIRERLDDSKLYSERTGSLITGEENIKEALQEVYDTIVSEGWSNITPSGAIRGAALANRRMDHRFLTFKDADSWIQYQEKFGDPNPFNNMMNHLDRMAKDIATMEILGPNPNSTLSFIEDNIKKNTPVGKKAQEKTKQSLFKFRQMYDIFTGSDQMPVNAKVARTMRATRSLLQAAQLGGATLSAISDLNTQRIVAKMNGLPVMGVYKRLLNNLNPLKAEENNKLATRLGLIAENWIMAGSVQQRYFGEVSGPGIAGRISDSIMRLSGLAPWTQANRFAFGMEFMGHLGDNVGKTFDDMDAPLRNALMRYGLGADEWNIMRQAKLYTHETATFLRPDEIRATHPEIASKFMEMINREIDFAIPTSSIRAKTFLTGGAKNGSFMGEVVKSAAMYKNYSVTVWQNNMMRTYRGTALNQEMMGMQIPTGAAKTLQALDFVIGATFMGGLALQLKEMAKGREPRDMDTKEFFGAALFQGGGLGIFGDFLSSSTNRFGGGLAQTIAGPVVGLIDDLQGMVTGNLSALSEGEDTTLVRDLVKLGGKYTPGQSLWYINLAFRRGMLEQLEQWGDPKAKERYRRQMQRYRRETGQEYWWKPGKLLPE